MRAFMARVTGLATIALVLGFGSSAHASDIFPAAIVKHLKIPSDIGAPDCTICHRDDAGGIGTVIKPFGVRMRTLGAQEKLTQTLFDALDRDQFEPPPGDVDCDGVSDIDELIAGTDPNNGPDKKSDCVGGGTTIEPAYGCGAHIAPTSDSPTGSLASLTVVAGLALSLIRRRK